jgi:hypothetical protein
MRPPPWQPFAQDRINTIRRNCTLKAVNPSEEGGFPAILAAKAFKGYLLRADRVSMTSIRSASILKWDQRLMDILAAWFGTARRLHATVRWCFETA